MRLVDVLADLDFPDLELDSTDIVAGAITLLRVYDSKIDDYRLLPVWNEGLDGFCRLGMLTVATELDKAAISVWEE